jgi:hypothetical protein
MEARIEKSKSLESQQTARQNLPVKKFRVGALSATIWENHSKNTSGEVVSYKNVSFERSYKDAKGDWQSTTALRAADLPKAILVLNKAYEYLAFESAAAD